MKTVTNTAYPSLSEKMTSHTRTLDTVQTPTGGSSEGYCTIKKTLMQLCRVYEEGLRVVKHFQRGERR